MILVTGATGLSGSFVQAACTFADSTAEQRLHRGAARRVARGPQIGPIAEDRTDRGGGKWPQTARKRLAGLVDSQAVLLPGGDEAEWSAYRDAWIDARDLAWVVAVCLALPLGRPAYAETRTGMMTNRS